MMRNGAKKNYYFSERFFKEINEMKNHSIYFHASYKGKIVSTELVIYGTDNCYSYLGGTDSDYFSLRPNDFLKFEIIKWAHENGLKNFVLGGGSGDDDGIFQYKSSLAPHGIVDFYVGGKTFQKEQYDRLVELYIKDNPECANSSFFPLYRSLAAH
jgi:lipid II:glycine glycyltransferase (peptidoglycan interpeptide bridge formation enzyme)